MTRDEAIEQAARVMSLTSVEWSDVPEWIRGSIRERASALADAGLLRSVTEPGFRLHNELPDDAVRLVPLPQYTQLVDLLSRELPMHRPSNPDDIGLAAEAVLILLKGDTDD